MSLFSALEWLGWSTGETWSPAAVVQAQTDTPELIWQGVRVETYARYKLARIAMTHPEVLVIGNSRVAQFRSAMFRPYSFYNLARVSWPIESYVAILKHLPEGYKPKLIIVSLDFFMLSDEYTRAYLEHEPVFEPSEFHEHFIELHNLATQLLQHPSLLYSRSAFAYGGPARGIHAILSGNGFRQDGSEQIDAGILPRAGADPIAETRSRWRELLTPATGMETAELSALQDFVSLARHKGIPLIAVQMPIYGPAKRLVEADSRYQILQDFQSHAARGYFDRMGIIFCDFLNFPGLGEDYHYFNDAVHPGEQLSLAVLLAMSSDPRVHALLPHLDTETLKHRLDTDNHTGSHIFLYHNQF